jgi:hypothetical protein
MVQICQEFGWTYHEYQSNPDWFNELVVGKMHIDAVNLKKQSKKNGRK